MPTSDRPNDRRPRNADELTELSGESEDADESCRDYLEIERLLLRARAERALSDVKSLLAQEHNNKRKQREIETAIDDLERIVECMADEPLPCIATEALELEDWFEYDELRYQYSVSANMPMLLEALIILVDSGVTPGKWILGPLAEAFDKILEDPDPELVATRLRLQGKGSGSKSPLQEYSRVRERAQINLDMRTLIEKFGVSHTKAANAVIEKFDLKVAPKTLVNGYEARPQYSDLVRKALDKHSDGVSPSIVWLTDNAAQEFLDSFPQKAQKYLKGVRPAKT